MRQWFSANALGRLYNYSLLLKAHFVLKCYEHTLSPQPQPPCLPPLLGVQGKYRLPSVVRMGDVSGVVDPRIQPGAMLLNVFVLIYFKKKNLNFGITLYLQKNEKGSTQFCMLLTHFSLMLTSYVTGVPMSKLRNRQEYIIFTSAGHSVWISLVSSQISLCCSRIQSRTPFYLVQQPWWLDFGYAVVFHDMVKTRNNTK